MKMVFEKLARIITLLIIAIGCGMGLTRSGVVYSGIYDQTRLYTRMVEFDYGQWTLDAFVKKIGQKEQGAEDYLSENEQSELVVSHLKLLEDIRGLESQINQVFADPGVLNPDQVSENQRVQLYDLKKKRDQQASLVEAIIQRQVRQVLAQFGLTTLGQEIPPVLFQVSVVPSALIVSPRDTIRQDVNISLTADLSIEDKINLEKEVESGLNVSALVVPIGGVGIYPTMVMSTTDINWLMEVVSHEWTHNYLTLMPLGMNYFKSGELRTMNETAANLSGKELGAALIARFYPQFIPIPVIETTEVPAPPNPQEPAPFDFRAEMHLARVTVDDLLGQGKVVEAEEYMEMRRQYFWQNGYQIRRLNQAYFAFYGAYADGGAGEAGMDPVGPAVEKLRDNSESLAVFLRKIGQMSSFAELEQAVNSIP